MGPKAYAAVYEYLARMEKAGVTREAIDEAEQLFVRDNYAKLYSGKRELTEEEELQLVDASWRFIAEIVEITEGKRLRTNRAVPEYDALPAPLREPADETNASRPPKQNRPA